jgi:hypothetical protein
MKRKRSLLATLALLLASLACRAAREILSTSTAVTPAPATASPSEAAPASTTDTTLLTCPMMTDDILVAATGYIEGEPQDAADPEPEVTYLISYGINGELLETLYTDTVSDDLLPYQQDQAGHQALWDYYSTLIPAGERGVLSEFSIVTDGEGNLLAAVAQSDQDPQRWVMEVDILDTQDWLNLTYTLIHESAHLLTLNPAQVTPSQPVFDNPEDEDIYLREVSACPTYFPGEGCAHPDSYLYQFFSLFWKDIHAEWQDVYLIEDDEAYYATLDEFYFAYEDRFLTDYAATNPEEDIAEAFSFFVLTPRPAGDTIAQEKILFFYEFPELVRLRDEIVDAICNLNP